MTDALYEAKFVNSLVLGIYRHAILLGIRTVEVDRGTELPVLEQVQPNLEYIQDLARYEHEHTE